MGEVVNNDLTAVSYFGNVSNNTRDDSAIVIGTDVNFTKAGVITVGQNITDDDNLSIFSSGTYNISYTYEGTNYVTNSTARTLLGLIVIFFVIAIILVGFHMVNKGFSDVF